MTRRLLVEALAKGKVGKALGKVKLKRKGRETRSKQKEKVKPPTTSEETNKERTMDATRARLPLWLKSTLY